MPKNVSILMPTYEPNAGFLREAIEGVMRQTTPHWTLLIHDDSSTADIAAMVAPYVKDGRIRFIRSERRSGIGGNWNACLKYADGDFVQFLFQDDAWEEAYLASCLDAFAQDPNTGMVVVPHTYRAMDDRSQIFTKRAGYDVLAEWRKSLLAPGSHDGRDVLLAWLERGLRPNLIGEPSFVMMRADIVEQTGRFSEDLPQGLDIEYWLRILPRTQIHVLGNSLGFFRVHEGGASLQNDLAGLGLSDRLQCFDLLLKSDDRHIRRASARAIVLQARELLAKFSRRVSGKQKVEGRETRRAAFFFLRHPVLLLRAFLPSRKPAA